MEIETQGGTGRQLSEVVAELRDLYTAFGEVRPQDMSTRFYIHAFNQYDTTVQDLLDTIDAGVNSASEEI